MQYGTYSDIIIMILILIASLLFKDQLQDCVLIIYSRLTIALRSQNFCHRALIN